MNDRNINNARFIQVSQWPQIDSHLTAKCYVDTEIDKSSLVKNNQDNDFNNHTLPNIDSNTLNKQAENDNEVITKAYVDQFHQVNERSRRDVGLDFFDESTDLVKNNQDNDLNDVKLTNLDSITVNRNTSLDREITNKLYVDNELDKNTIFRFNQTLQNYPKVSVGNNTYSPTKYDKTQITDTTIFIYPNVGGYLLQNWVIKCRDKNNNGKLQYVLRSTETHSPSSHSGAESLPPIGIALMYIETHSGKNGNNVFL